MPVGIGAGSVYPGRAAAGHPRGVQRPRGKAASMSRHIDRREFLQWLGGSAAAVALGPTTASAAGKARKGKAPPNIIFILTDDQRWDAMGCAGHPFLKTPHMDRLAAEGVRFRNAFVTTSLCSPSRASFLTGCYAHAHGVFTNGSGDLDPAAATFPKLLQNRGYETAFIGKWHMGANDAPRAGFDHWVSFAGQGKYYNCTMNVDGRRAQAAKYTADELVDHAIRFLRKPRNKPFLLCLSHKAVHAPFTPPKRYANLYRDAPVKLQMHPDDRLDDKVPWGRKAPADAVKCMRDYYAALTAVDENLGRLLQTLEELKVLDETAIVFAGDNGYFFGEHGLWDKRAAYEPSMRIPLLMRYPRLLKPGSVCEALVLNVDLAATLLELAGATPPRTMQGASWLPALAGRQEGRSGFLYEYFREADRRFDRPSVLAVRTRRWKYITYPSLPADKQVVELYDLEADPQELRNLAGDKAHAGTLRQMQALLEQLKKQTGYRAPPKRTGPAKAKVSAKAKAKDRT
jgi:N-acetylglucosamine-6-sulfatase